MGFTRSLAGATKVWFKYGFDKFLSSNQAMIRFNERVACINVVRWFLRVLGIGSYLIISRDFVVKLLSQKTLDVMFQRCIQRERKDLMHPHFAKLKSQSVRSQLTHFNKLLLFLEYYKLMEAQERAQFCGVINRWRKHLLQYSDPAKLTPLVDVNQLALKEPYANVLDCLMKKPHLIGDFKSAIMARDAALCKIARSFGKRPGELASIGCQGIIQPKRQELTFALEASPLLPSKVTYKYGRFTLYVSEELFLILKQYFQFARPIIAGTSECRDSDPLFIVKGGKFLSSKCVRDICIRGLRSGNSGVKVTPMSIRHTLSNIAHIAQKKAKNVDAQQRFTNAIAFSMRHTPAVHEASYIRCSKPILQSRTDSLETKLLNGHEITQSDIVSVTDESINKVLLPDHGPGPGPSNLQQPGAVSVSNAYMALKEFPEPKEYATPIGNRSTYSYIQELFNGNFHHSTQTSSSILHAMLKSQPTIAKKIKENLGLQHFNSLHKLQGKIKTYKTFLKKHQAKFWKHAPL